MQLSRSAACRVGSAVLMAFLASLFSVMSPRPVAAQAFSPYSTFQAMTSNDLKTLQVKLTYVGEQRSPVLSVVFTETSNAVNIALFQPFQRPGIRYSNELLPLHTFKATTTELKAVIDNVATLPNVTAGGVSSNRFLSYAMHNTISGGVAFEAVLNAADTAALFGQLRSALASNKDGMIQLDRMGCAIGAPPAGQATDVTGSVTTILSGLRLKRTGSVFVATLKVTNTTGSPIAGPVSAAFNLPATVDLTTFDGSTCKVAPAGRRFVNVVPGGGNLGAGQTAQATVEFSNPDLVALNPMIQVLAGTGSR